MIVPGTKTLEGFVFKVGKKFEFNSFSKLSTFHFTEPNVDLTSNASLACWELGLEVLHLQKLHWLKNV